MKRTQFGEEQIIEILRVYSAGGRSRYSWLQVSDVNRLRSLKDESQKLKKLLAGAHLNLAAE